jgi:hypothetical protein
MPPRKSAASSPTSRPGAESMFYWTAEDGTEIQLPRMSTLGAGLVRKHRKLSDADFLFTAWQQDSVTIPQS